MKKPAYQISEFTGHDGPYPAYLAVDGVHFNSLEYGSCAVTGYAQNPWWVVNRSVYCRRIRRCCCCCRRRCLVVVVFAVSLFIVVVVVVVTASLSLLLAPWCRCRCRCVVVVGVVSLFRRCCRRHVSVNSWWVVDLDTNMRIEFVLLTICE